MKNFVGQFDPAFIGKTDLGQIFCVLDIKKAELDVFVMFMHLDTPQEIVIIGIHDLAHRPPDTGDVQREREIERVWVREKSETRLNEIKPDKIFIVFDFQFLQNFLL